MQESFNMNKILTKRCLCTYIECRARPGAEQCLRTSFFWINPGLYWSILDHPGVSWIDPGSTWTILDQPCAAAVRQFVLYLLLGVVAVPTCSTSPPSGNLVDGLPLVAHTGAGA